MENRRLSSLFMVFFIMACLLAGCGNSVDKQMPGGEAETDLMSSEPMDAGETDPSADEVKTDSSSSESAGEAETDSSASESAGEAETDLMSSESADISKTDPASAMRFSFADLSNLEFWFGSGAGAWCTVLTVRDDGTFEGEYHDSDVDVMYLCNFTGKFTEPEKVDDYTYSVKIERIELEVEPGIRKNKDEITIIYSEPYGFDNAEELVFYLPGIPVKDLPEGYRSWMMGYGGFSGTKLPFYGLYNVNGEQGFSSHEKPSIDHELDNVEQQSAALENKLRTEAATQREMTEITSEIYKLWDSELNEIWSRLNEKLDTAEMDALKAEEREWIKYKETEIRKAGAEYEGGSMRPMVESQKGAELTRARVYELAKYLY